MITDINQQVAAWTLSHRPIGRAVTPGQQSDVTFSELLKQLEFFSKRYFSRYIPTLFPPHIPDFMERLRNWLNNSGVDENQQRILFEFALRIIYFSFEDFLSLYRSAFNEPVTRWIIDELSITLDQPDYLARIEKEKREHTWYCPVTDSMIISEFYHVNGIAGVDQRPSFRVLKEFSSIEAIQAHMKSHSFTRLVLMEDFVGTATQTFKIVRWAAQNLKCKVLFVPMLICPSGDRWFRMLATSLKCLRVEPILRIDNSAFIPQNIPGDKLFEEVANFAAIIHHTICGNPDKTGGEFGYKKTGSTVVLFSNTPDNTMPIIHHNSHYPSTWKALFPRVARETL